MMFDTSINTREICFHHVINQILHMHLLCTILNQLSHLGVNLKFSFLQYHIFIQELYRALIIS